MATPNGARARSRWCGRTAIKSEHPHVTSARNPFAQMLHKFFLRKICENHLCKICEKPICEKPFRTDVTQISHADVTQIFLRNIPASRTDAAKTICVKSAKTICVTSARNPFAQMLHRFRTRMSRRFFLCNIPASRNRCCENQLQSSRTRIQTGWWSENWKPWSMPRTRWICTLGDTRKKSIKVSKVLPF
jgi:hypothetical protein